MCYPVEGINTKPKMNRKKTRSMLREMEWGFKEYMDNMRKHSHMFFEEWKQIEDRKIKRLFLEFVQYKITVGDILRYPCDTDVLIKNVDMFYNLLTSRGELVFMRIWMNPDRYWAGNPVADSEFTGKHSILSNEKKYL